MELNVATVIDEEKAYMTPQGRLTFAQSAVDGQLNKQGELRYQCSLLFPPDSDFKVLKKAMLPIAMKNLDNNKERAIKAVNARFLDPNNPSGGGKEAGEEFEGWTLVRMGSKFRPDFVFPNGQPMTLEQAKTEVYSGRWARASCNPYWFSMPENKGVTLGLQNVQLLEHGENIGGGKPPSAGQFGKVSDEGATEGAGETTGDGQEEDLDDIFD